MKYCKHDNTELVIKQTQRKVSQLTQPYYYSAYYFCPTCRRMYFDDKFKIINDNYQLFTQNHDTLDNPSDVNIWTDGACTNNGNASAKAAWAFVSGKHEEAGRVEGKQTNNTAEAYAIYHALLWAVDKGYKVITIHSDSQITLNNLQKLPHHVKANQDIFQKIANVIADKQLTVRYQKVTGHSGDTNNDRADKLANGLVAS